jgi:cbb3-type cytochrome oxidase maturation protein
MLKESIMPDELVFTLVGTSLVFALSFLIAFIRSVRSGQYEDLDTPPLRILTDDKE